MLVFHKNKQSSKIDITQKLEKRMENFIFVNETNIINEQGINVR
jgi:hypothetical protein